MTAAAWRSLLAEHLGSGVLVLARGDEAALERAERQARRVARAELLVALGARGLVADLADLVDVRTYSAPALYAPWLPLVLRLDVAGALELTAAADELHELARWGADALAGGRLARETAVAVTARNLWTQKAYDAAGAACAVESARLGRRVAA